MTFYVVRHAIAEDAAPGGDDGGRRLTAEGRRKMRGVVRGLRIIGVEPDVILTSPLMRAVETADILVAGLRGAPEPRTLEALGPDVAAGDTLQALRVFGRNQQVMVVGHEPNLSSVLSLLLTGSWDGVSIELKKGACAAVEVAAFEPRAGAVLRWLLPPRALRRTRR
jgi:phosphohistidine phosphatase